MNEFSDVVQFYAYELLTYLVNILKDTILVTFYERPYNIIKRVVFVKSKIKPTFEFLS